MSDSDVVCHFKELGLFQALGVSSLGGLALLASKTRLALVNLDHPKSEPAIRADRKYMEEVKEIQFSYGNESHVALCQGASVELMDWGRGQADQIVTWKAHGNKVTDLSWHEQDTDLLATSSVDRHVHIWDSRDTRVPMLSLRSSSGASQVCWERIQGHTLATSNLGEIKIWDRRNASAPVKYINAHLLKSINALDFSTDKKDCLVSTGMDKSVKFWDIGKECKKPEKWLKVPEAPVWKARYTPFDEGLVTLLVQNNTFKEHSLMLWNAHRLESPVHTFLGHTNMILEFCWRNIDYSRGRHEYQLVTYSKDLSMRICTVGQKYRSRMAETEEEEEEESSRANNNNVSQVEISVQNEDAEDDFMVLNDPEEDDGINFQMELSERDPNTSSGVEIPPPSESHTAERGSDDDATSDVYEDDESSNSFEHLKVNRGGAGGHPGAEAISIRSVASAEHILSRTPQAQSIERLNRGHPSEPTLSSSVTSNSGVAHSMPVHASSSLTRQQVGYPPSTSEDLMEEYRSLIIRDNLSMERFDPDARECYLRVDSSIGSLRVRLSFPEAYPCRAAPVVTLVDSQLFATSTRQEREDLARRDELMLQELRKTAEKNVARNKRCLQHLARHMEQHAHKAAKKGTENKTQSDEDYFPDSNVLGGMKDLNVPYPRSCGARFCPNGLMIVFGTKIRIAAPSTPHVRTPRSFQTVSSLLAATDTNSKNFGNNTL